MKLQYLLIPLLSLIAQAEVSVVGPGENPWLARDRQERLWLAYEKAGDICLRYSQDNGQSWCPEISVCHTPAHSQKPSLALDSNGIPAVIWLENGQILFSRASTELNFPAPIIMSSGKCQEARLAASKDDSLHIVWSEPVNKTQEIFYSYSHNNGKAWTRGLIISHTPGLSSQPVLALSADNLAHVAWLDASPGDLRPDVFAVHGSQDTWTPARNVSNTAGRSQTPDIWAGDQKQVYLVWSDSSRSGSPADIYFARSQDNGPFTPPIYFDTPTASTQPVLAADNDNHIAVAWTDTSAGNGTPDIFMVQSSDAGVTFTLPLNISQTAGSSRLPSIVYNQNQYVIIWEESEAEQTVIKLTHQPLGRKVRRPVGSGKY